MVRVCATVAAVPGEDSASVFRRLLELNGSVTKGVAFGIFHSDIVLVNQYSADVLEHTAVTDVLRKTEALASQYAQIFLKDD